MCNSKLDSFKFCIMLIIRMKFLSQSSAVAMDATESRMDTVRNLNAAFESQNIMLMSEVKGVKNRKSSDHKSC